MVSQEPRFKELHARMTSVGGGPNAFSASEMHELSEYIDELIWVERKHEYLRRVITGELKASI